MTKKHALTLSITEIKALELRCKNCAGMVSLPLGYKIPAFLNCPGCGGNLLDNGDRYTAVSKLYASLVQWNKFGEMPLDLTFTVDLPVESE